MIKLAKREEQIMEVFWELKRAYVRQVIPLLPDPKPHYNSVATMVKILEEKGFLSHEVTGNTYCFFPVIKRAAYHRHAVKDMVSKYFDNSYTSMLTFFAKEEKIPSEDIEEILRIINKTRES